MSVLRDFPVTEQSLPDFATPPVLSIIIPTFNRREELEICVHSIAGQVVDDLIGKVEVIISDNCSDPDCQNITRSLAAAYCCVGYMLNAENGGAETQILAAPWRARGKWMWIFGDDDLLAPGGLSRAINLLTTEQPSFVTLNRCVVDAKLTRVLIPTKHSIDAIKSATLIDLIAKIGVDQFSFISSQIYNTEIARQIDTDNFLYSGGFFDQFAYYIEGFHDRTAIYHPEADVIHRWEPDNTARHGANFYHLAVTLPRAVARVRDRLRLAPDLMEHLGGVKFAKAVAASDDTFVDNIIGYLWLAIAARQTFSDADWAFLEAESPNWRADRSFSLSDAKQVYLDTQQAYSRYLATQAELEQLQAQQGTPGSLTRVMQATLRGKLDQYAAECDKLCNRAFEQARPAPLDSAPEATGSAAMIAAG
jgi:glycosyltransferase involved in cell wall biosynthesis